MPGVLTALMGGSGAGKTTLMDVLAGRKTQGITQGELLVNGHSKQQETWARVVGYVEQARTARTAHTSWPTTAAWLQTMHDAWAPVVTSTAAACAAKTLFQCGESRGASGLQVDIHSAGLTVEESLRFSAGLRLTEDITRDTREAYVLEVLMVTELLEIRGSLVGDAGVTGLSVEQRRRLSIGVELVANPSVIVRL